MEAKIAKNASIKIAVTIAEEIIGTVVKSVSIVSRTKMARNESIGNVVTIAVEITTAIVERTLIAKIAVGVEKNVNIVESGTLGGTEIMIERTTRAEIMNAENKNGAITYSYE